MDNELEKEFNGLVEDAANGDAEALSFLRHYLDLGHRIDDVIDTPGITKEHILQTFILAITLFSMNSFYLKHRDRLYPLVISSLNSYATSVMWEKSDEAHLKTMADHLRSAGVQVIEFVALICGGIERMRVLSMDLRENSWLTHHNEKGESV